MGHTNSIIGVDESGKGDFFGPLVVAGCFADEAGCRLLKRLGVRDSKLIAERKLLSLDEQLRAQFIHAVVILSPEEYNREYQRLRNLNKLLADGHARTIDSLLQQLAVKGQAADLAISDKFGKEERLEEALAQIGCDIPTKQIVRGEAILQVAAASIMARAEFIRHVNQISRTYGLTVPRGAAPQVEEAGRRLVARYGQGVLVKVAKVHFKNYRRVVRSDFLRGN